MTILAVLNKSTLVNHDDALAMTHACETQVFHHAAPLFGAKAPTVRYYADESHIPKGSWVITLLDTPDQAGALGWHSENDDATIVGEIFAQPSLDAGSTALSGPYAISSVLSHEVLEAWGDPHVNLWADRGDMLVAVELCDPVESDSYDITLGAGGPLVSVSNFVLPAWFDWASQGAKYDYLGRLSQPFSMTAGGYWVQMAHGKQSEKFGEVVGWESGVGFDVQQDEQVVFSPEFPEWKKALKLGDGRLPQRLKV